MANPVKQRLGRLALRLRFLLWQRRRHNSLVLEEVAGRDLLILPSVMNPALFRSGEFLARCLDETLIPPGSRVLDMGTGSGIGALTAAAWAEHVVAVDINPAAVRNAQINALLNGLEDRICVRQGDLFVALDNQKFDVVLFNPPFFRGTPQQGFDYAWRADDTVERFAAQLHAHLLPNGFALVILSTDGDTPSFLRCFAEHAFRREVLASQKMLAETLTVYRFTPVTQEELWPQL